MARNFRRNRAAHPIADLNVTNLIDLGFILLIIFMIATPLIQQEQTIPVNLPQVSKAPATATKDDRFIAVGVDARGFYVENNSALTLTQLRSRLNVYANEPKPPVVRIRADAQVYYEKFAQLLTELQKVGLTRFTLDTQVER